MEAKKMELIESLLLIQDKDSLREIGKLIKSSISRSSEKRFRLKKMQSFDEWNSQFSSTKFEDGEKIPGLNITLLEFRKKIFKAEKRMRTVSFEQFKKGLKHWKSKKI